MAKTFSSCLRNVIVIQEPMIEDDNQEIWQDIVTVRAEVQAMHNNSSSKEFSAMQMMDSSYYRFRIRFINNLKINMRIIYNDRYFYIKRVINQSELNEISIIIAQENL